MLRRGLAFSAVALAALAAPVAAAAQERPPPDELAAIAVYHELLPTSTGARPGGAGAGRGAPLPERTAAELRSQPDPVSRALPNVATSPAHGAPTRPLPPIADEPPDVPALSEAVTAAEADSTRLVGLLLVIGATTILLGAAALRARA